jgi:hypothetical protein
MKIAIQCVSYIFILVVPANAQQIGSVDLTQLPTESKSEESRGRPVLPSGCERLGGGIADGGYPIGKTQPHGITVEVTSMSNKDLVAGSFVQAEVRLRNMGEYPINIPWSTDPSTVEKNQNPNRHAWQVGSFQVLLDRNDLLKSPGQTLYGSKFSKGSMITIQHGEWIAAAIKFRLELEYPTGEEVLRMGNGQLRVEWKQAANTETLDLKKCEQWSGHIAYDNFYQQQNRGVTITITRSHSSVR